MAHGEHLAHTENRECIWGARNGHAGEIVEKVVQNMIRYLNVNANVKVTKNVN